MFYLFWDSIKVIVSNLTTKDKDKECRLPISIAKDLKKCHDYDMDTVVFIPIRYDKYISPEIHKCVQQFNPQAYEKI